MKLESINHVEAAEAFKKAAEAFLKLGVSLSKYAEHLKKQKQQYHAQNNFPYRFSRPVRNYIKCSRQTKY